MNPVSQLASILGAALVLAIVVEALIEYFGQPIPSKWKPYASAILGVLIAVIYGVDALGPLLDQFGVRSLVGNAAGGVAGSVLTGFLISRGSNVFNDLVSRLRVVQIPAASLASFEGSVGELLPPVTMNSQGVVSEARTHIPANKDSGYDPQA